MDFRAHTHLYKPEQINSISNLINGTSFSDVLVGDTNIFDQNDQIFGFEGNDTLIGLKGDDTLDGGLGNDSLDGGDGNDSLLGGVDNDILNGGNGNDFLDGGSGIDYMNGGAGNDTYIVDNASDSVYESYVFGVDGGVDTVISSASFNLSSEIENLTLTGTAMVGGGNNLNNSILGNDQSNNLYGMDGNDSLVGNAGNDTLMGDRGNDTLDGGLGNDLLIGANASSFGIGEIDTLTGGLGADTFALVSASGAFYNDGNNTTAGLGDYAIITDFSTTTDTIQLKSGIASVLGAVPGVVGLSGSGIFIDNDGIVGLSAGDELVGVIKDVTLGSGAITPMTAGFSFV